MIRREEIVAGVMGVKEYRYVRNLHSSYLDGIWRQRLNENSGHALRSAGCPGLQEDLPFHSQDHGHKAGVRSLRNNTAHLIRRHGRLEGLGDVPAWADLSIIIGDSPHIPSLQDS
jgi:hypothetical protein